MQNRAIQGFYSLLLIGAICLPTTVGANERQLPFAGRIGSRGAALFCGPGARYYETGRLTVGAEVTVHRRAPGGWLAIRPPHGSFSWMLNDDLRGAEGSEVAKVVAMAPLPGSEPAAVEPPIVGKFACTSVISFASSVRRSRFSLNGQPKRWWRRIAPPTGEFRWIQQTDLTEPPGRVVVADADVPQPPVASDKETKEPAVATVSHEQESNEPKTLASESEAASLTANGEATIARMEEAAKKMEAAFSRFDELVQPAQHAQWRRRGESEQISGPESATPAREVRFRDRNRRRQTEDAEELPEPPSDSDEDDLPLDGKSFRQALHLLDAEFSLMVSRPMATWQLTGLKARAIRLAKVGPTALHRGRAALLLDSIQGFDELYVRHLALRDESNSRPVAPDRLADDRDGGERLVSNTNARDSDRRERLDEPNELPEALDTLEDATELESESTDRDPLDYRTPTGSGLRRPATLGEPSRDRSAARHRYDAAGTLKRVTSKHRIAPPYALVDDEGEIVALVKPSPGLNLQSYLGRRVGMYGTQRTLPSFRKTLLTAERVVRMDRTY